MDHDLDDVVRRTIGGDASARARLDALADEGREPIAMALVAVLLGDTDRLEPAAQAATSTRDRQIVAIASAHLSGDRELVGALARDHLVDYPDSLIVAWLVGREV